MAASSSSRQVVRAGVRQLLTTATLEQVGAPFTRPVIPRNRPIVKGAHRRPFTSSSHVMYPPKAGEHSKSAQKKKEEDRYNYNTSLAFSEEPDPEYVNYRRVTAADLALRREPPTRVTMLVREFIHDSLYNPHYGYFSKNAVIFSPPEGGYPFTKFRDQVEFQEAVAERYVKEYGDASESGAGRQVWHTPTELFKPYYAHALTSAILQSYKLNHYPYQDLIIYELGAGNGSFMIDSLKFLKDEHPEVYDRTKYRIIEISPQLAQRQRERAKAAEVDGKVEIIEKDFFQWEGGGEEPCYVVALEVFDNLAHDMVRYHLGTLEPFQAIVVIDKSGDFQMLYEPVTDPLLKRYLSYRHLLPPSATTTPNIALPLAASGVLRTLFGALPFAPNLSKPDFIPSKAMLLLERLRAKLPQHRLLVADFDTLPDTVPGRTGPVVQTRVGGQMVPCETFLVKQGYFDIFFPTDFQLLKDIYSIIMNAPVPRESEDTPSRPSSLRSDFFTHSVRGFRRRQVGLYKQDEFVRQFGGPELIKRLTTRDGASLLGRMYGNAKIMF